MAKPSKETASGPLDIGWCELGDGRWEAARASFEEALADEETPEAFEGLSWAAWWLDDAEAVFAARERAYRLYKKRGDACGRGSHGHLAGGRSTRLPWGVWLWRAVGCGVRIACWNRSSRGPITVGSPSTRATSPMRVATPREPGSVRPSRLSSDGASTWRTWRCWASRWRVRRSWHRAQVEEGMRCLDEATATALEGEATIPISSAWACCFLVTACMAVRDYERAFEWCDRIAEFAERYGSRYMLAFCRAEYGAVHCGGVGGRKRRRCWRPRRRTSPLTPGVGRGSAGRAGGAEATAGAGRRKPRSCSTKRAPRRRCSSAALAWRSTGARRSVLSSSLERLLRRSTVHRKLDRAPALELLVRARIARGELDEAASALEALQEVERLVGTAPLRACADLAEGMLAAAGGDHERARPLLEDAVDRFERERCAVRGRPGEDRARHEPDRTRSCRGGRARGGRRRWSALLELGAAVEAERARRLAAPRRGSGGRSALPELTPRERDVLRLLAEGLTNRQIAERLVVSEHTIHRHVTNILRKLDLRRGRPRPLTPHAPTCSRLQRDSQSWLSRTGRRWPLLAKSRPTARSTVADMERRTASRRSMAEVAALARIEELGRHHERRTDMTTHEATEARAAERRIDSSKLLHARCGRSATTTGSRPRWSGSWDRCLWRHAVSRPVSECSTSPRARGTWRSGLPRPGRRSWPRT